jgi:dihydroorotase
MLVPNTNPPLAGKAQVEYISKKSATLPCILHPMAALTKDCAGKELAEMHDLKESGACAFSDGLRPLQDAGVMLKALQYVLPFGGTIIQLPINKSISPGGLMHEGISSTRLGLPGKPAMAEEMMIARDIELLRYTGSKLHITGVSTARGLDLIRQAKKEGLSITCSVTPYHCSFSDEDLSGYDTNLKTDPPLRSADDVISLRKGLQDGTIDTIASHHLPLHSDEKDCEFEKALSGMAGLESLFGVMNPLFETTDQLIEKITVTNRRIFGLPIPALHEGAPARLTLFDPDASFILNESDIRSRSHNYGFFGKELKGRVIGTVCGPHINMHSL